MNFGPGLSVFHAIPLSTFPLLEVGERSLRQNGLCNHATERQHGQTAVGNLLKFHVVDVVGTLALEETTIQSKVTRLATRALQHLDDCQSVNNFRKTEPKKELSHGTLLYKGIVGRHRGESHVLYGGGVDSHTQIDCGKAHNRHHADATMFQFGFTKEVDGEKIRETEGVETSVAHVSRKVGWVLQKGKRLTGLVGFGLTLKELGGGATWVETWRSRTIQKTRQTRNA